MVTITRTGGQTEDRGAELKGLSTDKKPIKDIPNGSSYYEMDTKKVFMFDEQNSKWLEQ